MRPPLLLLAMSLALLLAPAPARAAGTGTVSGVATWAGGAPGVGVEVEIDPVVPDGQAFTSQEAITDAQGRWQSPLLPAGAYYLVFVVQDSAGSNWTVATEQVSVGAAPQSIATVLEGGPANPIGFGTLAGTVRYPGGFIVPGGRILLGRVGSGELPRDVSLDAGGHYSLVVPAGRYELSFEDTFGALDAAAPARAQAAVSAGATSELDLGLSALAIARGSSASHSARDLRYLNDERAAWGLPAGIVENPLWSQACASHDAYQSRNHLLAHPEDPGRPGYSPGGHWAGTHSVLSMGGGSWTRGANPWEDAPIHLVQLFTPDLGMTGIDESREGRARRRGPGSTPLACRRGPSLRTPGTGREAFPRRRMRASCRSSRATS